MDTQQAPSSRRWAAIISLFLSGLSLLMVGLALAFGSSVSVMLTCMRHEQYPMSPLIALVWLFPIFIPVLLAIILSFVAPWRLSRRLVLSARLLSIVLFSLNLLVSPYLLLVVYWFDAPVPCR